MPDEKPNANKCSFLESTRKQLAYLYCDHKAWHLRIQRIKQTQWITVFNQFLLKTPNRNAMTDMENESYNKTKDIHDTDINKMKETITYLKMTRISKELHREHAQAHTRLFQKILWFLGQTNGLDVSRIHSYVQWIGRVTYTFVCPKDWTCHVYIRMPNF